MHALQNCASDNTFQNNYLVIQRDKDDIKNIHSQNIQQSGRNKFNDMSKNQVQAKNQLPSIKINSNDPSYNRDNMSNDSSSYYKDDEQVGQNRKQKTFNEKILAFKSSNEKKMYIDILKQLILNIDNLMNVQNIELRDINNPLGNNQNEVEASNMVRRSNENFEDVAFHLTRSASMFNNATQDSRMQQQIIPNVTRIKIEKIRALRRYQAKH